MSEETDRHGETANDGGAGGGGAVVARVLLTPHQLDAASADSLRAAWRTQDSYIDHLETLNKQLEGSLEKAKEVEDRIKQQYAESQHREKVLVRRLAAKEQEIQDYVSQVTELKSSHASLNGRPTLLDPAVNVLILRLKQELTSTKARLEETQNELSAWKFTPDSNTGKKLMAKCRLLHQENEDLGRMTSSGRIAKLEGDLALQKSFSEEVKKSQSELDEFLQELDEDVEGMQSTVLFLQQELRATHATVNGNRPPSPVEKRTYSGTSCASHYDEDDDVSYTGTQVWRTELHGAEDILLIKKLIDQKDISIWNLSPVQADYLVRPENKVKVDRQLKSQELNHTVLIMDVQRRIDSLQPEPSLWDEKSLRLGHRMNFKTFPTLKVINEFFNYLADSYPSLCRLQNIGRTAENRPIQMVNISNGNPANKIILVTAGVHSREWISVTSALYILNDLASNFDNQPDYIKNKNWLIIPVLNPDGYEYTHTKNRLWRKNRSGYNQCKGVDINRNFAIDWSVAGITVNNPCEETYSGPFPFSEAESIALRYLLQKTMKVPSALMDLHSYGQLLLYPWSARNKATDHIRMHRDTAQAMSQAISNLYGKNYTFGATYHMIYPATGALIDWAYHSGVLQSFAIETRDIGAHGFLLPAQQIENTGMELLAAARQLARGLDVVNKGREATWFRK